MIEANTAAHFWAAVEACLVTFHHLGREAAAAAVTGLWRRLPAGPAPGCGEPSFHDMIYHAEPWQVACNLAGEDLPLAAQQASYQALLKNNGLA